MSSILNPFTQISGPWTPTIIGSDSTSGNVYATQAGHYLKSGRGVVAHGFVALSTKGTMAGYIAIGNLPFPIDGGGNNFALGNCPVRWDAMAAAFIHMSGQLAPALPLQIRLRALKAAGTSDADVVTADLGNTSGFIFTATYVTTA